MSTLDSFRLDNTRALITGASRGIGRAVAVAFAQAGARLALSARSAQALKATAEQVAALGTPAVLVPGDLAIPEEPGWVVDEAARLLGGLDLVVHNAGILPSQPDGAPLLTPLQQLPQQAWDEVVAINLNATAALCRHAHPHLAASDAGNLVLMSSVAGVIGTPMMEAYAVSKAAQVSLARSLAVGWARQGIRVNALCPGWTRTDMTAFAHTNGPLSDWLLAHVPLGRWAEPAEVAAAALFLASPAAGYLTGHALLLDGGVSVPDGGLAGIPKPPSPFTPA
ncbi:NAD(P)-dependent dehydrogenase (short-subunit alcohol dehydrogenase family) [Kitasatospora sp. GAS204A]|uniref:SDR family NAD(P)-dependent oxidoreductase n=1 Tax=unclassified Kitasatospora TaxID=2633591 RepID=UPI0024731891|nr:SDR family oxidoreductase [Kitasatospora sp. GAS204B]MDH6121667.1 NAD(P)-dependent dehydrogenase (short-subunit alcohol dehydrogenase family) [Kitasatospora sp. GAS204B]